MGISDFRGLLIYLTRGLSVSIQVSSIPAAIRDRMPLRRSGASGPRKPTLAWDRGWPSIRLSTDWLLPVAFGGLRAAYTPPPRRPAHRKPAPRYADDTQRHHQRRSGHKRHPCRGRNEKAAARRGAATLGPTSLPHDQTSLRRLRGRKPFLLSCRFKHMPLTKRNVHYPPS
jgi:hypothetical protein